MHKLLLTFLGTILWVTPLLADTAAERGKKALERRNFNPPGWTYGAFDKTWKFWGKGLKEQPKDYAKHFMLRYGMHPAPFDNGKYPMGLREARGFVGDFSGKGLTTDCLLCHGSSIFGNSYVGLGNSSLDIQAYFEEMNLASGGKGKFPITFSNTRGTTEAGMFAIFLLSYRQPNLNFRTKPIKLDYRDDMCEDVPAWWLLHKKKTMYHTGATPAKSVRSLMQFMLASVNGRKTFEKEESTFQDLQAYILSLRAPKYPFAIDQSLANQGKRIFEKNCSSCHGTYGNEWTYPNKVIPLEIIGTDKTRYIGISREWGHYYNKTWFAKEKKTEDGYEYKVRNTRGYQAPPLDGIWATAPYLHNGSVPTVYHMLNSKTRPEIFTRSYQTREEDYDKEKLGWKVQSLETGASPKMPGIERRKIYNTRLPGRGNQGHTFGDNLSESERSAVIEYLKTL